MIGKPLIEEDFGNRMAQSEECGRHPFWPFPKGCAGCHPTERCKFLKFGKNENTWAKCFQLLTKCLLAKYNFHLLNHKTRLKTILSLFLHFWFKFGHKIIFKILINHFYVKCQYAWFSSPTYVKLAKKHLYLFSLFKIFFWS